MDNEPINTIYTIHMLHTRAIPTVFCDAYLDNVNCFISAIRNNRTFKGASYLKRSFPTVTVNRLYEAIQMLFNSEIAISSHVCSKNN